MGAADTFGQFQLARLSDLAARRDLSEVLKHYQAAQKLAPTDSTKAAFALWEQFIVDHVGDALAKDAAGACEELARAYEECGADDAAHSLYVDLAAFAAKQPAPAQAAPDRRVWPKKLQFRAAGALDLGAHVAFAKQLAAQISRPGVSAPPAKISDEFLAADAAYGAFLKAHPDSPLANHAVQRLMFTALDYARADAWDVADGIFQNLLEGKDAPPLRDPQRLALCRAMCQVGKVMPDHAKQVLASLASGTAMRGSEEGRHGDDLGYAYQHIVEKEDMEKNVDDVSQIPAPELSRGETGQWLAGGGGSGGAARRARLPWDECRRKRVRRRTRNRKTR